MNLSSQPREVFGIWYGWGFATAHGPKTRKTRGGSEETLAVKPICGEEGKYMDPPFHQSSGAMDVILTETSKETSPSLEVSRKKNRKEVRHSHRKSADTSQGDSFSGERGEREYLTHNPLSLLH